MLVSFGFSTYKIISAANKDNFTSSFPIWMPFLFFVLMIALARTSSTMWKMNGEIGHPCFLPDVREKAFSLSPLSMMMMLGLTYMAFIMLKYVFSIPNLLSVFILK